MYSCLSKAENTFLKKVDANVGNLKHDYSDDEHYSHALETLGGAEYLQKNYPLVYELFETAKEKHLLCKYNNESASSSEDETGFSDSTKVNVISYDNLFVLSTMSADFVKIKPSIGISAKLIDKSNDQIVDVLNICGDDDIHKLDGEIKKLTSELISSNDREFSTVCDFFWMEVDEHGNPYMSSSTSKYNDFKVDGLSTIVSKLVVNDPIPKHTPDRKYVVVVYNRTAQVGDDYDYAFDNNKFSDKGKDYVKVYLPTSGTVTLTNDYIVLGLNESMGFALQITDLNNGVVNYYMNFDSIETTISADKRSLTWKFNDYWNNVLNVSNFNAKTTVNIYNKMEIDIQKVSTGMKMHIPVVFQSNGSPSQDPSFVISKPIMIQWGCLGKDTMILMADHTLKVVSEISIGDTILNENMEAIVVKDIYTGQEEQMVKIETTSGKKVLVSSGHPVVTKRGVIAARRLTAADEIKTVNGFEEILNLQMVDYNDTVYSLSFETENTLIGNDIVLGDFNMQQEVDTEEEPKEVIERSERCIKARNEFRKLMNELASMK